jgi:NAD(P)-dependent dehydrogenase (short-subunit alcohol dehydrogenase family)
VDNQVIVVVGAGQGIGASVARRFGRAGYDVALLARNQEHLEHLGGALQNEGITTGWTPLDVTDADALTQAIERFGGHLGSIQHLHFNPSAYTPQSPLELSAGQLLSDLHLGVASLLTAIQAARPFMHEGARVTATGGGSADRPSTAAASLGVQKAALRNLVTVLDGHLKPDGIRAMTLTVLGTVKEGTPFAPDLIADALFAAAKTPDEAWRTEIRYTGSSQ